MLVGAIHSGQPLACGIGVIAGTVTELLVPGAYRVRLYHRASGRLLRETWSGTDGAYRFEGLALNEVFFAVGHDHGEAPENAGIADYLTAEAPA